MMKDPEKTIGSLIDKASLTQICYLDDEGYPITKAMLKPRKRLMQKSESGRREIPCTTVKGSLIQIIVYCALQQQRGVFIVTSWVLASRRVPALGTGLAETHLMPVIQAHTKMTFEIHSFNFWAY